MHRSLSVSGAGAAARAKGEPFCASSLHLQRDGARTAHPHDSGMEATTKLEEGARDLLRRLIRRSRALTSAFCRTRVGQQKAEGFLALRTDKEAREVRKE